MHVMHVMYVIALCMYAAMLLGPLTLLRLLDGSLDLGPGFGGSNRESTEGCFLASVDAKHPFASVANPAQPSWCWQVGAYVPPVGAPLGPRTGFRSLRGCALFAQGCSLAPLRPGTGLPSFDGLQLALGRGFQGLLP